MIQLAELIRNLRLELERALESAPHEGLHFELGPVEIEASVVVERAGEADTKVRFLVLESKAQGRVADERTQRITLTLQPRLTHTERPPYVSGDEVQGER